MRSKHVWCTAEIKKKKKPEKYREQEWNDILDFFFFFWGQEKC